MLEYDQTVLEKYHVKIAPGGAWGGNRDAFLIPCSRCGRYMRKTKFDPDKTYLCDSCKGKIKRANKRVKEDKAYEDLGDAIDIKHAKRFDKAIDELNGIVRHPDEYRRAIDLLQPHISEFDSIPEVMVGLQLLHDGHVIYVHPRAGGHNLDFAVKDLKCIVEVDGSIYHADMNKEALKDYNIRLVLGAEWAIVHIPAEYIRSHIWKLDYLINMAINTQIKNGSVIRE